MPIRRLSALAIFCALAVAASTAQAQNFSAMSCPQLWQQRNAILKSRGFCFRDQRAIQTFGNEGCTVTDENRVQLSPAQRDKMALIVIAEKSRLCR